MVSSMVLQNSRCIVALIISAIVSSCLDCGESRRCQGHSCTGREKMGSSLLQINRSVDAVPNRKILERDTEGSTELRRAAAAMSEASTELHRAATAIKTELRRTASVKSLSQSLQQHRTSRRDVDHEDRTDYHSDSTLIYHMIRPDPWNCDLIGEFDPRRKSCGREPDNATESLKCGNKCTNEHANAFRTLQQIGALPCCPTPPFCAAPKCSGAAEKATSKCTPRSSHENLKYMTQPDVWPAYHGRGGSLELDILKLIDSLGCRGDDCTGRPFDLMLDLGANYGYYTEKLTVRNFANHYIMIEAQPNLAQLLRDRWNNDEWKQVWFTEQAPPPMDEEVPQFEVIHAALSNNSLGMIDLCTTEEGLAETGCNVSVSTVDSLVPGNLTPAFQEIYEVAHSAFLKIDTEGMDELVLRGMPLLLGETRGRYDYGTRRYLVNFFQFEYSPYLNRRAKKREHFSKYDLKTVTQYLESVGFATFLIGPRFLPLSHGSWDDKFMNVTQNPSNNAGKRLNYPKFGGVCGDWCAEISEPSFTSDIFAIRTTHPRFTELKVALGACKESQDFDIRKYLQDAEDAEK